MQILWDVPDYERLQRGFEVLAKWNKVTLELLIRFMLVSLQREHTRGVKCAAELSIKYSRIQHALRSLGLDDRSLKWNLNHAIPCFASAWCNADVEHACLRTIICSMVEARRMSEGLSFQQLRKMIYISYIVLDPQDTFTWKMTSAALAERFGVALPDE